MLYKILENPIIFKYFQKTVGSVTVNGYKKVLLQFLPTNNNLKILDVGCGIAYFKKYIKSRYYGIDINERYLMYSQKIPGINLIAMNAEFLGFRDGCFDFAYSIACFHHLDDSSLRKTLIELKRVTKKDRKILIIDVVLPLYQNIIKHLIAKLDRGKFIRPFDVLNNIILECFPERQTIKSGIVKGLAYDNAYFEITN